MSTVLFFLCLLIFFFLQEALLLHSLIDELEDLNGDDSIAADKKVH
jgi:hypothetical protein